MGIRESVRIIRKRAGLFNNYPFSLIKVAFEDAKSTLDSSQPKTQISCSSCRRIAPCLILSDYSTFRNSRGASI